jgi:hypothetical protein
LLLEQFNEAESKLFALECDLLKISRREIQRDFENSDVTAVSISIWAIEDCNSTVSIGQTLSWFWFSY